MSKFCSQNGITGKPTGNRSLGRPRRREDNIINWLSIREIEMIRLRTGIG